MFTVRPTSGNVLNKTYGLISPSIFPIVIQVRWKCGFNVTPWQGIISLQNFVHVTTAKLSCQVHNFITITWLQLGMGQKEMSVQYELRWENRSWNGPLIFGSHQMMIRQIVGFHVALVNYRSRESKIWFLISLMFLFCFVLNLTGSSRLPAIFQIRYHRFNFQSRALETSRYRTMTCWRLVKSDPDSSRTAGVKSPSTDLAREETPVKNSTC